MPVCTRSSVATPLAVAVVLVASMACFSLPASLTTQEGAMDNGRLQTLIESYLVFQGAQDMLASEPDH